MAQSKLRRAIGAVKDQTSIGLAKVGSSSSLSDVDVAIVKATRHDEFPAEERHIQEILNLTCYSRVHIGACVNTISRRLNKTRNWTVALKTLMLIQRLLADGDPGYEQEIFFATRCGTRLLNMSDFRDTSQSNAWDFSAFVRTYALYLDERLEHKMQGRRMRHRSYTYDEDDRKLEAEGYQEKAVVRATPTPPQEMGTGQLVLKLNHLQQLIERFLSCKPTGAAKNNRIVFVALYPIVKDSFQTYSEMMEMMAILIDRFPELEVSTCVKICNMFARIGKQLEELDSFYSWCKSVGIARSSEYPEIEMITRKKLDMMDELIREKTLQAQDKKAVSDEPKAEPVQELSNEPEVVEEDTIAVKALPPPEVITEAPVQEEEKKENLQVAVVEADLLDLGYDDAVNTRDHGDHLALALFDGAGPTSASTGPGWEAFNEDTPDWENKLVKSASKLSSQPAAAMGGGFDMVLLNGMYQQGAVAAAVANVNYGGHGSASSVAFGLAGRPTPMLALPAPSTGGCNSHLINADPFAASLTVPAPAYVQMTDLEKKQRLLAEEQRMWQQYAHNGIQGQIGFSNYQASPYNMGGYPRGY